MGIKLYCECPYCGSNLDYGEKCDCMDEKERGQEFYSSHLKMEPGSNQLKMVFEQYTGKEVPYE